MRRSASICSLISLSLLTWPTCIYSMINIGGRSSLPGSEAKDALGTIPSGLRATLYLYPTRPRPKSLWLFYHIITYPSPDPTLIYLSLCLQLFHPCIPTPLRVCLHIPYPHDIQGGLLPSSPG